jgi:RNA polymerase primary sigma factor
MSAREVGLEAYFKDINRYPLLTKEEERALAIIVREGNPEARDRMVRSNLRLVVSIAKHYVDRGLPLLDLIEEGNLGLLKGVERFDPAAECRFSTYATWWIKQSIKRALIDTVKAVRIPSYMVEVISKWKKAAANLSIELGRPPLFHEIAERLEIPLENTKIIQSALHASNSASQTISIENSWSLSDVIEDKAQHQPHTILSQNLEIETVESLLALLDDRDARILRMRYGIDNGDPMTLKEIGERVSLSRERVRQIENEALKKLYVILHASCEDRVEAGIEEFNPEEYEI